MTDLRAIQATAVALFTDEFRQSLPGILAALDAVDHNRGNRTASREAHRLIHALKGGASMVGLAAFGYLLNVAEELIEVSAMSSAPVTDEVIEGLRASMPRFASYMESALTGQPVEPIALGLARTLRVAGGNTDTDALKNLLEIEAREVAQLPTEIEEQQEPAEEAGAVPIPIPVPSPQSPVASQETPVSSQGLPVVSPEAPVPSQ